MHLGETYIKIKKKKFKLDHGSLESPRRMQGKRCMQNPETSIAANILSNMIFSNRKALQLDSIRKSERDEIC